MSFEFSPLLDAHENGKIFFNTYSDIFIGLTESEIVEKSKLAADRVLYKEIITKDQWDMFREGIIVAWNNS